MGRTSEGLVTLDTRFRDSSILERMIAAEAHSEELQLIAALRAGDEGAFLALVQGYHSSMIRVPRPS